MSGHLVSNESIQELHSFTEKLGIPATWFRDHPRHPHYRLLKYRTALGGFIPDMVLIKHAFELGAKVVSARRLIEASREWNGSKRPAPAGTAQRILGHGKIQTRRKA